MRGLSISNGSELCHHLFQCSRRLWYRPIQIAIMHIHSFLGDWRWYSRTSRAPLISRPFTDTRSQSPVIHLPLLIPAMYTNRPFSGAPSQNMRQFSKPVSASQPACNAGPVLSGEAPPLRKFELALYLQRGGR